MNRRIWKALGIAVCMLALAAPRAMAELREYLVSNNEHFADAVGRINNESKIGDENEIVLMHDITLEGNYILTNGKTTTIKGKEGEDRKISIKGKNAGITVTGEKTVLNLGVEGYDKKLTIEEDTRDGSASENPRVAFITVSGGATANMYENVTLQNGEFAGNACVVIMGSKSVTGSNSVFNMYGGVIENCSRAVMADSGTTFNMSGGEIRNCVSMNDGGGLYADNSTINITGGTISGCEGRWGGGLYATNSSKITITGGTISGCTAGAGGGLYVVGSTLNIKGGTISECFVSDTGKGGGLFADQSTLTISGGTIKGNKAAYGGGVALRDSRVKEEEPITNWTVVDNKAYKTKTGTGLICTQFSGHRFKIE